MLFGQYFTLCKQPLICSPNIYRLLNVYCEIFGTRSYGKGRTSLRVRVRHMNECRIFHNIHSLTFLLYAYHIYLLVSSRNQNIISTYQSKNCCKFKITLCHLASSYIFKITPKGAIVKMTFRTGCDVSKQKQTLMLTRTLRHFPVFLTCISYENLHYYPLNLFVNVTVQR